jgi:hypothetical protein
VQIIIPFASTPSPACRHLLTERQLARQLPHLQALLATLAPAHRDEGDEYQLSPPHERALARALGWRGADGALPWAAWRARLDGIDTLDLAWAELTPLHWHMGAEHLTVVPPGALALTELESRALFDAVRVLFEDDGWALEWRGPTRWYAAHESLRGLPTASLDRVVGRNPDLWMPDHPQARLLRRLQSEVQMLWYTHPVNEAREANRQLPVNSLWLSGCGPLQASSVAAADTPRVLDDLREPLFNDDWPAWAAAWQALDAGPLREALDATRTGQAVSLTLCGERHAQQWHNAPQGWWTRLTRSWRQPDLADTLNAL